MYKMRVFLAAILIFAAFAIVFAKPHNKKSTKQGLSLDEPKVPNDGPRNLNDQRPGPRGPPLILDDAPGPHDSSKDDEIVTMDDMTIPKAMITSNKEEGTRTKRQAEYSANHDYKWPKANGVATVPYTVGSGINTDILTRAIAVFNAKTCVRFVPRSSEANYVKFRIEQSCLTTVGNQRSGEQTCDLTTGCAAKKGKVLHEMMHVLSFLHEHCRPDRNSYVTVHTDRLRSGQGVSESFEIIQGRDLGIPYDCDSILHYRAGAFAAVSGQDTITSAHCSHLGNGDTRLSLLDYKRVNTLYNCGKPSYKYYKVVVVTDGTYMSGAGTDCYIYLTLHGSAHTSTEFELDLSTNPSANLFERGSTDTFNYMAYRNDLGTINGISVRMVAHGSGQAWYPNTFTVTDPASGTSVTFTNSKWLSPSSTYGTSNFPVQ